MTFQGKDAIETIKKKNPTGYNDSKENKIKLDSNEEKLKQTLTELGREELKNIEKPIIEAEKSQAISLEKKEKEKTLKPPNKISIFTEIDKQTAEKDAKSAQKARSYHKLKTHEYNIYGENRKDNEKKEVPCLIRTAPESKINQKYILTESTTDKRLKLASLSTRLYLKAPNVNELRNQGMHQTMISTLDKKNVLSEILEKKNLMITSEITDKLKKDLLVKFF